jgi:hypothetical protein
VLGAPGANLLAERLQSRQLIQHHSILRDSEPVE